MKQRRAEGRKEGRKGGRKEESVKLNERKRS